MQSKLRVAIVMLSSVLYDKSIIRFSIFLLHKDHTNSNPKVT